jgi:hypothetical protein
VRAYSTLLFPLSSFTFKLKDKPGPTRFVAQHKLPAEKAQQVYELMLMLRAKEDEIEGNPAEDMRVK